MNGGAKPVALDNLWLGVYVRPIHPEFFTIWAKRIYKRPAYDAEFWLVGPGHLLTVIAGRDCITEALVPQNLQLPTRGLLRRWKIHREHDARLEFRGPLTYQSSFQVEQMPLEEYLAQEMDFLASASKGGVFCMFDKRGTASGVKGPAYARYRPGEAPFAYAMLQPGANAFMLHTFHGFPSERTILKTQTVVDIA